MQGDLGHPNPPERFDGLGASGYSELHAADGTLPEPPSVPPKPNNSKAILIGAGIIAGALFLGVAGVIGSNSRNGPPSTPAGVACIDTDAASAAVNDAVEQSTLVQSDIAAGDIVAVQAHIEAMANDWDTVAIATAADPSISSLATEAAHDFHLASTAVGMGQIDDAVSFINMGNDAVNRGTAEVNNTGVPAC